jgi:hypothetical protein
VLQEGDVVVGPRFGDGIPHTLQSLLLVRGIQRDFEHADVIGRADVGVGEDSAQLLPGLPITRRGGVQQQHRDTVALSHTQPRRTLPEQREGSRPSPHENVRTGTAARSTDVLAGYIAKTTTEVSMLLAIAVILLVLAVVGGIAVHPLLFLIAVVAILALVAGRR